MDLIERQAAIAAVSNWLYGRDDGRSVDQLLSTLPSVQPLVIHCTDCEDWLERQSILGFTISELPSVQPKRTDKRTETAFKRLFGSCQIKCKGESGKRLKRANKRIRRENMME